MQTNEWRRDELLDVSKNKRTNKPVNILLALLMQKYNKTKTRNCKYHQVAAKLPACWKCGTIWQFLSSNVTINRFRKLTHQHQVSPPISIVCHSRRAKTPHNGPLSDLNTAACTLHNASGKEGWKTADKDIISDFHHQFPIHKLQITLTITVTKSERKCCKSRKKTPLWLPQYLAAGITWKGKFINCCSVHCDRLLSHVSTLFVYLFHQLAAINARQSLFRQPLFQPTVIPTIAIPTTWQLLQIVLLQIVAATAVSLTSIEGIFSNGYFFYNAYLFYPPPVCFKNFPTCFCTIW